MMLSAEADQILLNLKMIAKVRQHEKISTRNSVAVVEKNSLVQGLWRWVYGEKRKLNLQYLTQVFERSFAYLQIHPADFRVMTEIRNATQGLQNLKTTYEDDPLTVARIQVLIDNIESKMSVEPVPILAIKNIV